MGLRNWFRSLVHPAPLKIDLSTSDSGSSSFVPEPVREDIGSDLQRFVNFVQNNPGVTMTQITQGLSMSIKHALDLWGQSQKVLERTGTGRKGKPYRYQIITGSPQDVQPTTTKSTAICAVPREMQNQIDIGFRIAEWIKDSGSRQYIRAIAERFNITPREAVLAMSATGGVVKLYGNLSTGSEMMWGMPEMPYALTEKPTGLAISISRKPGSGIVQKGSHYNKPEAVRERIVKWHGIFTNPEKYVPEGEKGEPAIAYQRKIARQSLRKLFTKHPDLSAQILTELGLVPSFEAAL